MNYVRLYKRLGVLAKTEMSEEDLIESLEQLQKQFKAKNYLLTSMQTQQHHGYCQRTVIYCSLITVHIFSFVKITKFIFVPAEVCKQIQKKIKTRVEVTINLIVLLICIIVFNYG